MITLLLTATMSHAWNISNSSIISSSHEMKDENAVKSFEQEARSAHELSPEALKTKIEEAKKLLLGLRNHAAFYGSKNPNQRARTEARITRLNFAIQLIQNTMNKISVTTQKKKQPKTKTDHRAAKLHTDEVAPHEIKHKNPTVTMAHHAEIAAHSPPPAEAHPATASLAEPAKTVSFHTQTKTAVPATIKQEFATALKKQKMPERAKIVEEFAKKYKYDFHTDGRITIQ